MIATVELPPRQRIGVSTSLTRHGHTRTALATGTAVGIHPPLPVTVKLLITGGMGTGKTSLIRTASQRPLYTTDVPITGQPGRYTTVAGEVGWLRLHGVDMCLVGTPGHERFGFLWAYLATGAAGVLVLANPDRLADAYPMLDACERVRLPHLVVLTTTTSWRDDDIREAAGLTADTPLLHGDPTHRASVHQTLTVAAQHLGLIPPASHPTSAAGAGQDGPAPASHIHSARQTHTAHRFLAAGSGHWLRRLIAAGITALMRMVSIWRPHGRARHHVHTLTAGGLPQTFLLSEQDSHSPPQSSRDVDGDRFHLCFAPRERPPDRTPHLRPVRSGPAQHHGTASPPVT